ncbi:MAG: 3'-5' exonuclease [Thermodesulfobacteriota bacterium]
MFKNVKNKVWAFDVEWVPDPNAGKAIYGLPDNLSDREVIEIMWSEGRGDQDTPMPYLKTVLCRVVSLSMVSRHQNEEGVKVEIHSLPSIPTSNCDTSENYILETFLNTVGKHKPQIVGYNSVSADLKILIQRGVTKGIKAGLFAARPDKPWEGADYFSDHSDWNIDLMRILGGYGRSTPSLNEMAVVCGIPGKMGVDGEEVAPMWLEGRLDEIIAYNECDALTTYLLWLRVAHFGGFFSDDEYWEEQKRVLDLLEEGSVDPRKGHYKKYINEWKRLKNYL